MNNFIINLAWDNLELCYHFRKYLETKGYTNIDFRVHKYRQMLKEIKEADRKK